MGACAVMAGAAIIEVHVRSEFTATTNPDYPHSLYPAQLQQYVENVMVAEWAKGTSTKMTQPSEAPNRKYLACAS